MSGEAYLAIYPDGGDRWISVGWFYDREVQASWGAGLRRVTDTAWDQATADASSRLTATPAGRGWWYIYIPDSNRARMGRSEPPEFGNVGWISRSRGLGLFGDDGVLRPYPAA